MQIGPPDETRSFYTRLAGLMIRDIRPRKQINL